MAGSAAAKDRLVLALGGESTSDKGFDPTLGWGSYGSPLFQSTLLKRDANLEIVPDLATSWKLSEDRLTWTVSIRKDALFSDGSPLTAKDVAYTFNAASQAGGKVDLSVMDKAEAIDDYTVKIHLKKPNITFIQYLVSLGIVPADKHNKDYARNPIGSGPYQMVRWDEGQQLIVKVNPHYYGKKPAIKELVFIFADEGATIAMGKAGKVDVLGVPSGLAGQKLPNMVLHPVKSVDNRGLMFPTLPNTGKKTPKGMAIGNNVTCDVAIRKAVNYVIDRQAMVAGVLNGFGSPAYGVVDDVPWDNKAVRFKDNDLAKAREILESAGWKDTDGDGIREKNGIKAEFTVVYNAKDSLRQGLALAAADMVKPAGIKINLLGTSWDRIKKELAHSNVVVYGFGNHTPLEMETLYHTPGPEPGSRNAGFYSNPTVDKYFEQAEAAPSFAEAIPYWQKAQWDGKTGFSVHGDAAWAWLVNLDHTYYVHKCLDVGKSQMEPHGHGWPITANISDWKWTCK
ncbi:MAG: nickel ABC transporter substrate-binding protein [Deltaproteobacteria bacterium]|nr:MAG: nickel ABC transporter substrate-binding protein [Deltaproteobacteria bacterium]